MAEQNRGKAQILYDYLDESRYFRATVEGESRSHMNVCFRGPNEETEARFVSEATRAGLEGLKGHRSAGGMRASIYNAMPVEGCRALVAFMQRFERENA
jgi:phosphoserine aminotransferase